MAEPNQVVDLRPQLRTRRDRNTGSCLLQCVLLFLFVSVEATTLTALALFVTVRRRANGTCVLFAEFGNGTLSPGYERYCSAVVTGEASIAVLAGVFAILIFLKQAVGASG